MSSSTSQQPAPRFERSQRVRIIANQGGLYHAQIGIVGVIERKRQYRRFGYRTYDVGYQDAKGRDKIITSVREDDLEAVSDVADWLDDEPEPEPTTPAEPAKAPEQPAKFAVGQHVYVDPRSELAYPPYARKGHIGVIVGVGTPVRSIRRYDVQYAGTREAKLASQRDPLHALPITQVREEHLMSDEGKLRHACEYRAERRLRDDERLWCDKGGCFEDDCVVCQQTPEWRERHGLPLSQPPAPTRKPDATSLSSGLSTHALAALDADDLYEFAVALVRDKLESGVWRDAILAWQVDRQAIALPGGSTCYDVTRGGFYVTMIHGQQCSIRYALKKLVAEAERRIAGAPRQVGLWESEAHA